MTGAYFHLREAMVKSGQAGLSVREDRLDPGWWIVEGDCHVINLAKALGDAISWTRSMPATGSYVDVVETMRGDTRWTLQQQKHGEARVKFTQKPYNPLLEPCGPFFPRLDMVFDKIPVPGALVPVRLGRGAQPS